MKTNYIIPVRLNEELARKLAVMAAAEGRTPNAQFVMMLRNSIAYYERSRGRIDAVQMKNADLDGFSSADEAQRTES